MSASAGRSGRPWREAKRQLHATTQICHLCGHGGAYEADHVPPRKVLLQLGLDPNDMRYLRAAHGSSCPCPVCGQRCNQVKGDREGIQRMTSEW